MKLFISIATFTVVIFSSGFAAAQSTKRIITGQVTSFEESFPLEGVKVSIKGTTKNSGTQPDGIYYINIDPSDSILVFTIDGYQSKEIRIAKSNEYNVSLVAGGNKSGSDTQNESAVGFYSTILSRCCR